MIKLGVIYGGMSTEREVSRSSAKSVLDNLDKEKYEIYPIFIDEKGDWFEEKESNKIIIENLIEEHDNLYLNDDIEEIFEEVEEEEEEEE